MENEKVKPILFFLSIAFLIAATWALINTWQHQVKLPNDTVVLAEETSEPSSSPLPFSATMVDQGLVKVIRVVDGDTIVVEGNKTVRYVGIDTPETVDPRRRVGCFGKEASNENHMLVTGKMVRLEKDVSETDKYGRLLRYVYVPTSSGELFVNDYLVRQGFAKSYTYPPDVKYQQRFIEAQKEAQENNRGLWQSCPTKK